ncbi:MAG: phage replisome organizer N-terminal domain-containing protein [Oscillospiraceae bacterium]|nr:phage replisome organizer N-terminal domain-containing protein [Oscillospiraceae bacterium]
MLMADVKWIKITTDIFDDEKILLIESLPDAYSIIVVWFKLLCLAGKQNNSGVFMMNDKIAYTDKMLATIFRMKETTVQLALKTFEEFGMVEIVDGVITIPNWGKHQNLDQLESKKEYMRNYMQEYREKQRLLSSGKSNCKTNSKANVSQADKEGEEEKEGDKKEKIDYQLIADMYNSICKSFPSLRSLSDARKKAIAARLKTYTVDDIRAVFENAEASSFLKGGNNRNWTATFDWLMNGTNMAKVLDGNYCDKRKAAANQINPNDYDNGDQVPW